MSSFPFYSQSVREHLLDILSHHEQSTQNDDHRHVAAGSTILGKRYQDDSSSDDEDGNNLNSIEENDDSSASSSDGEEESSDEHVLEENEAQSITSVGKDHNANKTNRVKKPKGSKRSDKEQLFQKMHGKAPSISLSLPPASPHDDDTKNAPSTQQKALQIPTILLPPNYIRDNPNWDPASAAKTLLTTWDHLNSQSANIIIVLLQSGRFVAAVYTLKATTHSKVPQLTMIAHKTSTRYTIRKGQGGSQSNYDSAKHKAKSVGAQLRREGEKQLREDVVATWKLWRESNYIQDAMGVYVSCPKGMKREYLFGDGNDTAALVRKGDERLRSIPLDVGRPILEGATVALECLLSCGIVNVDSLRVSTVVDGGDDDDNKGPVVEEKKSKESDTPEESEEKDDDPPLTPLHEAVIEGDLSKLMELLTILEEVEENTNVDDVATAEENAESPSYDVNTQGGPDHQTPLHFASASNHQNAPSLLNALLINGHANPSVIDSRGRPPYFVASSDKAREAFRLARGTLGEEYCRWDDEAKVGPALTDEDVQAKKAKALEKKRKQRARQKEKKALEKAQAEEEAAKQRQEEEKKKQMEDAKRVRDGLKPKSSTASNVCDFCQKPAKGKRRSQMFQRLDYVYCSTDCVKKHQRELMAAAAAARMGC
mmetsp:Transcript_37519/g.55280  ORF Transcript_37519/g.55280 Transcript_37519/m.55280 type:complete len:655 (+) Transcript_37519:195-2159(+)